MKPTNTLLRLIFVLIIVFVAVKDVAAHEDPSLLSYQDIFEEYGLQFVELVPEGITPLEFTDPVSLNIFLSSIRQKSHEDFYYPDDISSFISQASVNYTVITRSCSVNSGLATFNTWADIRVGYTGSFRWIDSVLNTRIGLTGITTGVNLTNDYSYAHNQTATSISVTGGGIINVYLVIEGGIAVFSQPVSCTFTYQLS